MGQEYRSASHRRNPDDQENRGKDAFGLTIIRETQKQSRDIMLLMSSVKMLMPSSVSDVRENWSDQALHLDE